MRLLRQRWEDPYAPGGVRRGHRCEARTHDSFRVRCMRERHATGLHRWDERRRWSER